MERLLDPAIRKFIRDNERADIRSLALKKPPIPDWPMALILDQIKSRQKAATKIPQWLEYDNIIFPPSSIVEQASSSATAFYKASLINGESFADLTGGAGIDSWAIAQNFKAGVCVDHNEQAAELLTHNLQVLCGDKIKAMHVNAEKFVSEMPSTDLVYIDPQRRDHNRKGLFRLADCSPDITSLLTTLKEKANTVMIKTSPMLDIAQAIKDLQYVSTVHILEWHGDCKEVIYILNFSKATPTNEISRICSTLNDDGTADRKFEFTTSEETTEAPLSMPQKYLYEPGPAFQKAGAFNAIAHHYGVSKLHKHTHLYTSEALIEKFPGRSFEIIETLPVSAKALKMRKANLTVRNFPSDVATLRKKLKIKDGGSEYLFACTLSDDSKALLHTRKTT